MTQTFTDIVSTIGIVGVVAAFVGTLVVLMERTHRRTAGLPRAPFGADLEGDSDIRRTVDELRTIAASDPQDSERGRTPTRIPITFGRATPARRAG